MTQPEVATSIAIAVGISACVTDLRQARIPNALTFPAALAGFAWHAWVGGTEGALTSAGGLGVGLLIWLPLYAVGGIGGGDVKLLAAFGAWLGPVDTLHVALAAAIAGGVFAVLVACRRRYMAQAWTNVCCAFMQWRLTGFGRVDGLTVSDSPGPRLAYAVPMLVGLGVTLWLQ
jgi:prepilin peptidase CpaA